MLSILNIFIADKLLAGPYETIDTCPDSIIYISYGRFFAIGGFKKVL